MRLPQRVLLSFAAALLLAGSTPGLAATDYVKRFEGDWRGKGIVRANPHAKPRNVRCRVSGSAGKNVIDISGACRTLAIFKREIGAKLEREGDTFVGTYIGARKGVARLEGGIENDTLVLKMTFPHEIDGRTGAEMLITNPGDGELRIKVLDQPNGADPPQVTTDLTFRRL